MKNNDFDLKNLPVEAQDPSISKDDFTYVQADKKIHDEKFQTKPTTFLKDCLRRFAKNKSSVVAAFILGFLMILSVLVPLIGNRKEIHNTKGNHGTTIQYLEPRLFKAGTGFWDGTKKYSDIPVDTTGPREEWLPANYKDHPTAISNLVIGEETYTEYATKFGNGGYVALGPTESCKKEYVYMSYSDISPTTKKPIFESFDFSTPDSYFITNFDVYDSDKLKAAGETQYSLPQGFKQGECALVLKFNKVDYDAETDKETLQSFEIDITDYQKTFDINEASKIDVKAKFDEFYSEHVALQDVSHKWDDKVVKTPLLEIRVKNPNFEHPSLKENSCVLIKSLKFEVTTDDADFDKFVREDLAFSSGNEVMCRISTDKNYWKNYGGSNSYCKVHLPKATLCSFTYDTYEATFGLSDYELTQDTYYKWVEKGLISRCIFAKKNSGTKKYELDTSKFDMKILSDKCPLAEPFKAENVSINSKTGEIDKIRCKVYNYKTDEYGNLDKIPTFIFGTDKLGKDLFIFTFEGLRNSLLIGIGTTLVCFLFGLLWGSISGYFGGNVDLAMERFTDILSGIPWIVMMTLVMLKFEEANIPNFFTFAIALCLTGWIGTAATTRTQFYRFRGREYVLASRTLGASHGRLIAKHILPNAMGTIITSAVLMVPSVIFSEATINFIFHDMDTSRASLGVILSDNQLEIQHHPYLLIVPSIVIALVMISFNLFGNGLRDAVNPSLKGEGE